MAIYRHMHMCVCVCVCVSVCQCVSMSVSVCVQKHVCVYIYINISICIYICAADSFAFALVLICLWSSNVRQALLGADTPSRRTVGRGSAVYVRMSCNKSEDNTRHRAFMFMPYLHTHTHTHEPTHKSAPGLGLPCLYSSSRKQKGLFPSHTSLQVLSQRREKVGK